MGSKDIFLVLFVIGFVNAQNYRVCINSDRTLCSILERDDSKATCESVESRIDCAIKLARKAADIGVFSEEETLLLGLQQPTEHRVVASIRDSSRVGIPYAFEAVALVPTSHTGGLEALRGGKYCHPGLDHSEIRWSPRVLKTFEQAVARTDRCPGADTARSTPDELEVETLNGFFSSACRPGKWSANDTVDERLKSRFPNLCSLCTSGCTYGTNTASISVSGVDNNNRHVQTVDCLIRGGNNTVAYVSWQHAKEVFSIRNPELAPSYAVLCPDGTTRTLTTEVLAANTAPCAFVRQPWSTVVANSDVAREVLGNLRSWWPNGLNPGVSGSWTTVLFNGIIGGADAVVVFDDTLPSPANYTAAARNITSIDATSSCFPARRWCTINSLEETKCNWVRYAAYSLGVQPALSCQQRSSVLDCLKDIKENQVDFIASASNYGYLARQHYSLSPVKLLQNSRTSFAKVAAFIKETAVNNITRFENLRGKRACFPEFGGLAYVAFVRAAHERSVISASDCDYARSVGEFFDGACAPGAVDAAHALSESSSFNASSLCTVCKPSVSIMGSFSEFTCAWDYTNMYYGNNGSLACLTDANNDIAFLQTQTIASYLTQLNLAPTSFRALCRNNTLALTPGVDVDDACLLAHVVDAEIVTRRDDPQTNALSVLLDNLDLYFGYTAESGTQLINLEIYSPFNEVSNLLFKDSAIGITEPTSSTTNTHAKNYIDLFNHLDRCTSDAQTGLGHRNVYSIIALVSMTLLSHFVFY